MTRIAELVRPRRIVTGVGADGRSRIARIEEVDSVDHLYALPSTPAHMKPSGGMVPQSGGPGGLFRIWASDRIPVPLPTDGLTPPLDFDPAPEETPDVLRRASTFPPPLGIRIGLGITPHASAGPGRMHWTDSTDVVFVMAGQQGQILDEDEAVLAPGDVLIQNGTMHAHQTLVAPVVSGVVTLGALRASPPPRLEALHLASGKAAPYRGGFRGGETREKQPVGEWDVAAAEPRVFGDVPAHDRIEELEVPRRLVTATNEAGRSYFAEIAPAAEIARDGLTVWRVWSIDRLPFVVANGAPVAAPAEWPEAPGPLGVEVSIARLAQSAETAPAQSDSMDAVFVMAGEPGYVLDSGERVDLRPGDVLIQNGTGHAWQNAGGSDAVLGVLSVGAARIGLL